MGSLVTSLPRNILFWAPTCLFQSPDQKVFNFFAIFYQKKLLARKTPKLQKLKKWRYWWFLLKIVLPSSKGLLLRLMDGLIFLLTEKTNFFYLWWSFALKFSPKVKKQIFIRKWEFFNEKIFFWPFFKCASFLYNLPWLLQSNTCSRSSIYQWFFQNLPREGQKREKKI